MNGTIIRLYENGVTLLVSADVTWKQKFRDAEKGKRVRLGLRYYVCVSLSLPGNCFSLCALHCVTTAFDCMFVYLSVVY